MSKTGRALIRTVPVLAGFLQVVSWSSVTPQIDPGVPEKRRPTGNTYETTIVNLTKETIRYTLRGLNGDGAPVTRSLRVGETDHCPCRASFGLFFEDRGKPVSICLECGTPYSFQSGVDNELGFFIGTLGPSGSADLAPYFPTPMVVVEKMLGLADLDTRDILYDLGCGDGRIVVAAAKDYGVRAVGIDIDSRLIDLSVEAARAAGVEALVEFYAEDIRKADLTKATVVTLYLSLESNELIRPLLEERLKPGVTVISHDYPVPGWKEEKTRYVTFRDGACDDHVIYVYKR